MDIPDTSLSNISPLSEIDIKAHLDSHYQCVICTQILYDPVTILCQHTFCRHCLSEHMKKGSKKCPTCQKRFFLPATNINYQMRDAINELMDKLYTKEEIEKMTLDRTTENLKAELKDKVTAELRKELEDTVLDDKTIGNSNDNEDNDSIVDFPASHKSKTYFESLTNALGSVKFLNGVLGISMIVLIPVYIYRELKSRSD